MFSLLYGLWEYIFRKEELRILITGLDKSGKTTLLEKIKVRARVLVAMLPALPLASACSAPD
jgi:stage III sporulation protein SpoIIIAA